MQQGWPVVIDPVDNLNRVRPRAGVGIAVAVSWAPGTVLWWDWGGPIASGEISAWWCLRRRRLRRRAC
eukprot:ctg_44.g15